MPTRAAIDALIVDDNTLTADALAINLQMARLDVKVAHTYAEGESLLGLYRPRWLLVDQVFPGFQRGTQLATDARSLDPNLRVLLITAATDETVEEEAADAGVEAILHKPLDIPSVLHVMGVEAPEALRGPPP